MSHSFCTKILPISKYYRIQISSHKKIYTDLFDITTYAQTHNAKSEFIYNYKNYNEPKSAKYYSIQIISQFACNKYSETSLLNINTKTKYYS